MRPMCKPDYCYDEKPYGKKPYDYDKKPYDYKDKDCDPCDCKPDLCKAKDCHFCPKPVVMECACGTGAIIGEIEDDSYFNPICLGCLTIDTTCLCKPVVKFDFSSIISYKTEGDNDPVELTFTLKKSCNGGFPVCCGSWDYRARFDDDEEELTTSFTFTHCECNSCPGCCVYTVEITRAIKEDEDDDLSICNVVLSAIATSSC
ncbi:hypothetical protein CPJCM30710_21780 [Clostridium polyendosporum]|uniref:DUF4489 domain-containing protein n=1 Tax=Clostridium polyendosporum TaxID=69208 RepID=A0A919S0D4_9CLOT|nr:DUF4489 domain-containing protein [Clostridium polyendosporum]GIM29512.1 hypothetical protein CPJCM30710_21780 [Clostridium polyendosporum]